MKLTCLIQQLYHEPMLITAEAHASIRQLMDIYDKAHPHA